ncbi:McrB family protein [Pedobacter sp. MW01-1-1]|uniref:McrB family protein n=1 Tax=Pedobacter sp. MW01-1-1 TaxID=3383027 RepID=UPI003FEF5DD8
MKIFFGRISITNKPEQITEAYYQAVKGTTYFGDLNLIDNFSLEPVYVFMIADSKIHLWKAKHWGNDGQNLYFEKVIENIEGMNGAWLQAFKFFYLNLDLIIFTIRRPFKKAFFKLDFDEELSEQVVVNPETYANEDNYRKIVLLSEKPETNKLDFQLYKENGVWKINETAFFDNELNKQFRDNSPNIGKGRIRKDNLMKKLNASNLPASYSADEISILGLYDGAFCDYNAKESEIDSIDIDAVKINDDKLIKTQLTHCKNQILYGPPGTGKTFNTINKALDILGVDTNGKHRKELKELYEQKVDEGQIVFTTFHQSLSYEDFVEGTKPVIEEDKDGVRSVVYEIKDGIFKSLCDKARIVPVEEEFNKDYHFDDAWNALLENAETNLSNGNKFRLDILTAGKGLNVTQITNNGNLLLTPASESGLDYTVSYTRLKELHKAIPDVAFVKNIDKEFRAVIGGMNSTAYWATLNYINNWLKNNNATKPNASTFKQALPHVLIIDEINRGNVSAIFGELITLIEESKRAGEAEALEVILPYSKEKFSVPSNLYIIGTMNTADRSVEALDSALRRRFSFTEMMPEYLGLSTIAGIQLAEVLQVINKRIVALLDADHQIGHSYLISVANEYDLANAFNNCIIPLLKEYFYHDDEKIALVLGNGFVEVSQPQQQILFPLINGADMVLPEVNQVFAIKSISETSIINSLTTLLTGG